MRHELFHKAIRSYLEAISETVLKKVRNQCSDCSILSNDVSLNLGLWFFESLADTYAYTFKDYPDFIRLPYVGVYLTEENASLHFGASESNKFYQRNGLSQFKLIESDKRPTKPGPHSISRILHSFLLDFGTQTGNKDIFNIWFKFVIKKLSDEKAFLLKLAKPENNSDSNYLFPDLSRIFLLFEDQLSLSEKVVFKKLRTA